MNETNRDMSSNLQRRPPSIMTKPPERYAVDVAAVGVAADSPYRAITIVGPIVFDLVRRALSFGVEYEIVGHTLREVISVSDMPKRVEVEEQGQTSVRIVPSEDFSILWGALGPSIIAELVKIVRNNIEQKKKAISTENKSTDESTKGA